MAWDDTQTATDKIVFTEWNAMVTDIQAHWTLDGLTDTNFTGLTDGELPVYDLSSGKWVNKTLAEIGLAECSAVMLLDGSQAMTGALDMGSQNINNVGTIGTGTYTLTIDETKSLSDKQDNLTFGIADTNSMVVDDADAADNDYAKFTATGIEGRSYAEVKTDLSLDAVENTALSTWAGTANITTVGTIGTGTWQADAIDHERGGLEADISAYDGLIKVSAGATSNVSIGISDDNIVEIDDADAAALDYARFTANGIEGRSYSEVVSDLEVLPLSGGTLTGGLYVGTNEIGHSVGKGMTFDASGNATFDAGIYANSSTNLGLYFDTHAYLKFDANDYVVYDTINNRYYFRIGDASKLYIDTAKVGSYTEMFYENDTNFKNYADSGVNYTQYAVGDSYNVTTATHVHTIDIANGGSLSVDINGVHEYTFSASVLDFKGNYITAIDLIQGKTDDDIGYYTQNTYSHRFYTKNVANNSIERINVGYGDVADVKILNSNLVLGDGGTTDYLHVDDNGVVTLYGAAECELTLRPSLETGPIFLFSVPTVATVGAVSYYSLPIWNSDNEQLFFKQTVPGRWDGSSDLTFRLYVMLGGAEDVDDTFKFQFSWSHCQEEGTMSSSVSEDVEVQQAVLIDRTAEYSCYRLEFTINYDVDGAGDELKSGETLFGRLRRIASTGTAVTNEIRVTNWDITYHIDKFAKECGS